MIPIAMPVGATMYTMKSIDKVVATTAAKRVVIRQHHNSSKRFSCSARFCSRLSAVDRETSGFLIWHPSGWARWRTMRSTYVILGGHRRSVQGKLHQCSSLVRVRRQFWGMSLRVSSFPATIDPLMIGREHVL